MTILQHDVANLDTVVPSPVGDSVRGFKVRRVLPTLHRLMVGPFVLVDQIGPADFDLGHGFDRAPHPHIGIEILTY